MTVATTERVTKTGRTNRRCWRVLMILENCSFPEDCRVANEARSLYEAGHQVVVISPTSKHDPKWFDDVGGVLAYRYPKPPEWGGLYGYIVEYGYSLTMAFLLSWVVLIRHGFDNIHAHCPPDMHVLIGQFFRFLGKRYVMDHHDLSPELYLAQTNGSGNQWVVSALRFFERWSCRAADELISTNETQRRLVIQRCGVAPERANVVRNGPRMDRFFESEPLAEYRETGHIVIGYLGCIGYQDGVDHLIRSLGFLREKLGRNDFRAIIIGDGPAVASLKSLTRQLTLQDHVVFAGYQSGESMRRHLASCDIAVTPDPPSDYNITCTMIKTMEYMAMRLPIVGYDLPEHRRSAGGASLYAKPGDELDLARCLEQLMDDPALRARMGKAGRLRIEEQLAWDYQKHHLLETYRKLRNESASADVRSPVST